MPQRQSQDDGGPLLPETTSRRDATQLTYHCLFPLKKCQSVVSQVSCSSSCFSWFFFSTLFVFPCWLLWDQRHTEYFRYGEKTAVHTTCVVLRDGFLLWIRLRLSEAPGAWRHEPGPPVWEKWGTFLYSPPPPPSSFISISLVFCCCFFFLIWTKNKFRVGNKTCTNRHLRKVNNNTQKSK